MSGKTDLNIETECIHGGCIEGRNPFGAVTTPIFQTATFSHPGIGQTTGHNYTRESNPTREDLEQRVSVLEGALDTVACSSGMAAISLCMEIFKAGDHIICTEDLYGGSVRLFAGISQNRGVTFSYVDTSDIEAVRTAITDRTEAIYIETPSNPTMRVTDIKAIVELAKASALRVIVDNTFMSAFFQRPLELGADIVVQSGTKYLCGHNDTISGFLSTNDVEFAKKFREDCVSIGCGLAPFDCFLMIRGIKTLGIRMEKSQENALKIAEWLKGQSKISEVLYVGLPEHPGHEVNRAQSSGYGGMISFHTDTSETACRLLERIKVFAFAESLGGVESLVTYPVTQTHAAMPEDVRNRLGITNTLLRMSVGIENVEDLIKDLDNALNGYEFAK